MNRKNWTYSEERVLIDNYETCTIKELEILLPNRNNESINAKIKRLKKNGKLAGNKDEKATKRAFLQRHLDKDDIKVED